jgi:hypothetical protein
MLEPELCGVEHQPRCVDERALVPAPVHALADDRVTRFGEMNADLMRAARFERALDERCNAERLESAHVSDRFSAEQRVLRRTAIAVTPIGDET